MRLIWWLPNRLRMVHFFSSQHNVAPALFMVSAGWFGALARPLWSCVDDEPMVFEAASPCARLCEYGRGRRTFPLWPLRPDPLRCYRLARCLSRAWWREFRVAAGCGSPVDSASELVAGSHTRTRSIARFNKRYCFAGQDISTHGERHRLPAPAQPTLPNPLSRLSWLWHGCL